VSRSFLLFFSDIQTNSADKPICPDQQALYHCPNSRCRQEFKSLAAFVNHLESEKCGFMRFEQVQTQIETLVNSNRRITY
jgi:hypothetical protein